MFASLQSNAISFLCSKDFDWDSFVWRVRCREGVSNIRPVAWLDPARGMIL